MRDGPHNTQFGAVHKRQIFGSYQRCSWPHELALVHAVLYDGYLVQNPQSR